MLQSQENLLDGKYIFFFYAIQENSEFYFYLQINKKKVKAILKDDRPSKVLVALFEVINFVAFFPSNILKSC